jgi:hypothetical protein
MNPPRKRPIGKPLALTPEQIDQAAEVTPFDVAQARALWQHYAPPTLAGLLDAVIEDGGTDATKA